MGKSVRTKSDPFAFKPEYNNQVATTIPQPEKESPFDFKPEYNSEVKKNIGGTELQTSSPTQSASVSELPEETATDFLIKDIEANDVFSKIAGRTDQYFPDAGIKRKNQEIAEQTKLEVFSNPDALAQYASGRINTLKEKLKALESQKSQLVSLGEPGEGEAFGAFSGQQTISDSKKYNEINKEIANTSNYISRLKNTVANIASDFVVSQEDLKSIDPKKIGRKIVSIAEPDLDEQIKTIERGGGALPGIRAEEMERIGLNSIKNYLSRQPDLPEKQQLLNLVNSYEKDFDERNFLGTAQRVREKIGAQIYKDGAGGWLGFGYSPDKLRSVIDNPQTGLTESERMVALNYVLPLERKIVGTDIPTSGFTRSFYNAIEKSAIGAGKSLGDITGIRTEADIAADLLSQEADQSRYRPPGEGPTPQAKLSYLNQKGKLTPEETKQKKELENYVNVRNNWSRFKDGVGDLTGQVAEMVLLTKGLGAGGQLLRAAGTEGGVIGLTGSTIGSAISNDMVGLVVNGYLNSYDNYKQQALSLMPGESKAGERDAYAKTMATVEGLSEMIFPDTKVIKAFTSKLAPAVKDITSKLISQEITQQAAKQELQSAMSQYLRPFAKEFVKSELQESTEEAAVDLAQGVADSVFGGQQFDISKTGNQALNTFFTTMLYSPLVSGMAAHGAYRQNQSQNAFIKSAMIDMAANPAAYLKAVEDLQLSGEITQTQANEKVKLIKSANNYLQEIPASRLVTVKTGEGEAAKERQQNKPMDFPEVSSYLLHRLNEGILQQQIDNSTDEVLKSKLEKDVKRSQEIRKGIFDGSIGVTPDLQDVTNNPKKAKELGIADLEQMFPEQLIGTPFQKQEKVPRGTSITENENQQPEKTEGQAKAAESQTAQTEISESEKKILNSGFMGYIEEPENDGSQQPGMVQDKAMRSVATGFIGEIKRGESSSYKSAEEIAGKAGANIQWDKDSGTLSASSDNSKTVLLARGFEFKSKPLNEATKIKIKELADKGAEFVVGDMDDVDTQFINYLQEINAPFTIYKTKGNKPIAGLTDVSQKSNNKSNENKISEEADAQKVGTQEVGQKASNAENTSEKINVLAQQEGAKKVARKTPSLISTASPEFQDFYSKIKDEVESTTSSDLNYRIDIPGITNKERIAAIQDIEKGKDTKRAQKIIAALEDMHSKGEIPFIRGRGNHVERTGIPISELFSQESTELSDEDIIKLNSELGEEGFIAIAEEIFENVINPPNYEQEDTGISEETESASEGTTAASEEKTGDSKEARTVSKEKTIAERGKELADKIRQLRPTASKASATIFGLPIAIYDTAIVTIANAIEAGAELAQAIQEGIKYIKSQSRDWEDNNGEFAKHIQDAAAGSKPKAKIQVGEDTNDIDIDDYKMTTTDKVGRFLSGETWEDVFGENPQGQQGYEVQSLTDMLQDGRNMIAIAQEKWGNDVMFYGKPLFQLIQNMSNDEQLTNKKAVLLATFLGELQEAKLRSPERFDAINQLEKAVFAYYQNYMNVRGKEIVAGRLLRLYRDKYIGDIFADQILDEKQAKAKKTIQQAEQEKKISDEVASEEKKRVTAKEKSEEDKAAKEKSKKAKKDQSKKKKLSTDQAKQKADEKLKDIEGRLGSDAKKGLLARIKEAINKLNCK